MYLLFSCHWRKSNQNTFMNESKIHPPLLLSRALKMLPFLARVRERRYGELRTHLNIGDASLSRLLQNLEELGWIDSPSRGKYRLGEQFKEFKSILETGPLTGEMTEKVSSLARTGRQSCAWVVMEDETMTCKASHSIEGSITILKPGAVLSPEFDHAAALAILSLCEVEVRKRLCLHPQSTIESEKVFHLSSKRFRRGAIYLDLSQERRGVSRLAIPFSYQGQSVSLYFCGPSVQIRQRWRWYRDLLLDAVKEIKEKS